MFERWKLQNAFRAGGIYRTVKANKRSYEVLPKIHSLKVREDFIQYVFTLPNGFDPKEIDKKGYVFKQVFGEHIKLYGDYKKFTLTVYKKQPQKIVPYNYERFAKVEGKLPIICGEDVNTEKLISFDMTTHPHILNGGQTGGGKSTWLRTVLTFLIQNKTPEQLHLYLGDLKAVEFMLFRQTAHVKRLETEVDGITNMLEKLNSELDRRQKLMLKHGVTYIDKVPNIPYIVCFIDEFQDLCDNEEATKKLLRVVAKGRALGVFLVLTTQRPSASIVDSNVKANLTVSMSFKTRDKVNSNIILGAGAPNAAKLNGQGHAIVAIDDYYEIQAPLLEEEDAKKILEPYKVEKNDITSFVEIEEIEDVPMIGKGPLDE